MRVIVLAALVLGSPATPLQTEPLPFEAVVVRLQQRWEPELAIVLQEAMAEATELCPPPCAATAGGRRSLPADAITRLPASGAISSACPAPSRGAQCMQPPS
ncbi:MAG TPA: hypothetical protein VF188_18670, partial [Longimicrobiales bacterium]